MGMYATIYRVDPKGLAALHAEPERIHDFMEETSSDEARVLELDKTWHGLHYLLTETAWDPRPPLDFIANGGTEIGDEDVGYGPARSLDPDAVRAAWQAMEKLSEDDLRRRFDPKKMTDVYPNIWDRDPAEDDTLGWLLEGYPSLRSFVQAAAANGDALIVAIS